MKENFSTSEANNASTVDETKQTSASANESTANNSAKKKSTKKRKADPFWTKVNRAHTIFENLMIKNNSMKWNCLAGQIRKANDPQLVLDEYWGYVKKVLGRVIILEECKAKGIDPEIFATHLVFLGRPTMNRIMEDGLTILGKKIDNYKEAFVPKRWEYSINSVEETVSAEKED